MGKRGAQVTKLTDHFDLLAIAILALVLGLAQRETRHSFTLARELRATHERIIYTRPGVQHGSLRSINGGITCPSWFSRRQLR